MLSMVYDKIMKLQHYTLFYDPEQNVFRDDFGAVIFNIHNYVTPNELMMFLNGFENMYIQRGGEDGLYVQLIHPNMIEF